MNKRRRKSLDEASGFLEKASTIITRALDEEEDCLNNIPENLIDSERCIQMESAVENMEEAASKIDDVMELISEAMGN